MELTKRKLSFHGFRRFSFKALREVPPRKHLTDVGRWWPLSLGVSVIEVITLNSWGHFDFSHPAIGRGKGGDEKIPNSILRVFRTKGIIVEPSMKLQ